MKTKTRKPKTVYALFKGHPERWTKETFARDADDEPCSILAPQAVSWCLIGAVELIYHDTQKRRQIFHTLARQVGPLFSVPEFNDESSFTKVLAVVKKARV